MLVLSAYIFSLVRLFTLLRTKATIYMEAMDPLSISASVVGLGSATVMIGKRLEFLKSIPKARLEFCQLLNEMTALQALLFQINNSITLTQDPASSFSTEIPEAVLVFQNKLSTAISSIDALCDRFRSSSKGLDQEGYHRIPRARWAWEQRGLPKLREEVKDCRDYLLISFGALNITQGYKHALLAIEHYRGISESTFRITQRLNTLATNTEKSLVSIEQRISSLPPHTQHDSSLERPSIGFLVQSIRATPRSSVSFDTMLFPSCREDCACRCHMTSQIRSWPRLEHLIGRLSIHYNSSSCNSLSCHARSETAMKLTYHFPTWVMLRAIYLAASVESMAGSGAGLHVKIPRVISSDAWIWYYIVSGNLTEVQRQISSRLVYPTDIDDYGMSLLARSILEDQHEITSFLLQHDSDMYFEDRYRQSPVSMAWMRYLRSRYAGPQRLLHPGFYSKISSSSLIHRAIYHSDHVRLKEILLTSRIGLNELDVFGYTPLHWAVYRSDWTSLRILLDHGANHNVRDPTGGTLLNLVSLKPTVPKEVFDLLIRLEEDLNHRNVYGQSALHYAARSSENMTVWLLKSGADPNIRDWNGSTPLGSICHVGSSDAYDMDVLEKNITTLLSHGAEISTSIPKSHPLFSLVDSHKHLNLFRKMLYHDNKQ
ncbi:ankyrin repeat-containing domain protein [Camillea tinctor]|nr:ankyrin repeat-containing domain protein [Camillea tinctor]